MACACTQVLMNFETPSLGNEGMWAGIFEAGCTQIWEVLEADEGGGHMAPVGMQQKHSLWTLAHTKGLANHRRWRVRAWGYPASSRAVDKNSAEQLSFLGEVS